MTEEAIVVSEPKHIVYWQVQADCMTALSLVGLHFDLNYRIPIFKVYTYLENKLKEVVEDKKHLVIEAQAHLNRLIRYRQNGYEPAFEGEKYK